MPRSTHVIVRSHHPRLRRVLGVALAVGLLAIGWLLYEYGRRSAGYSLIDAHQREQVLSARVADLDGENQRLTARIAILEKSADVDRRAYEEVDRSLSELQNELLELRQEVDFYRGIVHSEGAAPGLRIQSFKLRREDQSQYQYRLVLTHLASTRARIEGEAEIVLSGIMDGAEVELSRSALPGDGQPLQFSFRHFQELRGSLTLPAGFVPLRVILRAAPKGRAAAAVEHVLSWAEVTS